MRYLPSMWIGQLSGRQGSTVATHGRFSSFFRNRVMPVNPRSPAQTLARDALTALTQNWKSLTAAQRNAWSQLAQLVPVRNTQGVPIILTGHTFYIRLNLTRRSVGNARIDTAPAAVEQPPSFSSNPIVLDGTGAIMTIGAVVIDPGVTSRISIWATQFLSPGKSFINTSDYRLIASALAQDIFPQTIRPAYEAVFGTGWQTMVGMRIAIKIIGISASGFEGDAIETSSLII